MVPSWRVSQNASPMELSAIDTIGEFSSGKLIEWNIMDIIYFKLKLLCQYSAVKNFEILQPSGPIHSVFRWIQVTIW